MATPKSILARPSGGLATALVVAVFLPPLLLAGLLVLVAPLPQLAIHARWCSDLPGPLGGALLLLGAVGATAVVVGLVRGRAAVHRAGMVLVVAPVIGVALLRAAAAGEWRDLPLLGAFLFSVLLVYLAASEGA
jgi:hypothetical protein